MRAIELFNTNSYYIKLDQSTATALPIGGGTTTTEAKAARGMPKFHSELLGLKSF